MFLWASSSLSFPSWAQQLFKMHSMCKCSHCSLACIAKPDECKCCMEMNRCREKIEELEKEDDWITLHPGFNDVCLNRWVLETAAIGLKTKPNQSYTELLTQGKEDWVKVNTTLLRLFMTEKCRKSVLICTRNLVEFEDFVVAVVVVVVVVVVFLRSVAYRQFVCLVWQYTASSKC